ncbi:glycosyltransferase family 4 protein [Tulasnella calospora MUT 4182]|uniref:Glycosyltransferase family 4 protein n=1 Tax=Tulasnella calospora MUT 4182 TaxID=1051891 RepID=A0A0C3PRG4_9AGAM|nr:glycosyltransferase family 4 protein [Tulasnella calospora MUT 4182]
MPRAAMAALGLLGALIVDHITRQVRHISKEHLFKFVGGGVTETLHELAPTLCTRLWLDLDMVPMVFKVRNTARPTKPSAAANETPKPRPIDEQADSAVRKLVMYFGPSHNPRLSIGYRNQVEVDANGLTHILDGVEEYRNTCREGTWNALNKYATDLRERDVKIAFFSSTPQGGGVALMRHAIIRLLRILGVNATWYVPKPSPAVFRHTKNNHNILQGVADPSLRPSKEATDQFTEWITYNAERYWLSEGGPLAEGGIDVAFIDDPQMPGLIPLIKKARPDLPIVYRSHIEIRSDLVHVAGSPQAEVWKYLWDRIQLADLFISHPVAKFVPSDVPIDTLALLPAATDWLDGLSKPMRPWDLNYYMRVFKSQCSDIRMNKLLWPARGYICQVARFDPAKGIPDVIDSFCKLRRRLDDILPASKTPQLLICGHGAIDDPDASIIYDQTMALLEKEEYAPYASDIVVMRIGPSDQMLNALLTNAKIVLQLSLREGFEVKVSESLHHGKPTIATRAGGIPLQIIDGKSGYLVDVHDTSAVANHLYNLWTDKGLYDRISAGAAVNVSDEVGTCGNAASWLYLASKLSKGEKLKPNGRWINDMMREDAGEPYRDGEPRLKRDNINIQG